MIPAKARSNRVALVEVTVTGSDRNHKQRTGFPLVVATEKTARPQLVSCGHAVNKVSKRQSVANTFVFTSFSQPFAVTKSVTLDCNPKTCPACAAGSLVKRLSSRTA
jgi:hypothetical protein